MLQWTQVVLRYGPKMVLDGATATVYPGEKVGVVGRNGAGKSSLFALMQGRLQEEGGSFSCPSAWRMAWVAQEMPECEDAATDFVIAGDTVLAAAQKSLDRAVAADDGEAMGHAYLALEEAGAYDAEARAQSLLMGLGFSIQEMKQSVNAFSGGWRMRLQLARALMAPSDLLLLDEPTNHLDLDALLWLAQWLKRYSGTILLISHDKSFLDTVSNVTLHVHQGKLTRYSGNYSFFEKARSEQLSLQAHEHRKQEAQRAHLQWFIARFKAKASKAKQAQSRVKALERMELIAPVLSEAEFQIKFEKPHKVPDPALVLEHADLGYGTTTILSSVSLSLRAGDRIGILGANGQGKSTLVKSMVRAIPPVSGTVLPAHGLSVGYFAQQELDVLRPSDNPMEHMVHLSEQCPPGQGATSGHEQHLRDFLGRFDFGGERLKQTVGSMSGGEKARLVLCMMVWQRPNVLVLDEPTNHLDLNTREALSIALNDFEGAVLLVSHDRSLLESVCDGFWLVGQGRVSLFRGDLDDYHAYLIEQSKQQAKAAKQATKKAAQVAQPTPDPSPNPEHNKQIAALERKMTYCQEQLDALNERLITASVAEQLAAAHEHETLLTQMRDLEEAWLALVGEAP